MTTVRYDRRELTLRMEGHAGADEKGKDPVCAALSMLMLTLERRMLDQAEQMLPTISRGPGRFLIRCRPGDSWERSCRESFETIFAGLTLLAEERPDCVQIQ
ncbi:MAG: ribosomal-processing cysteine protease Prp [Oscillospiraceae bacterium]|nr:ribosomal-processing cysteine protease Prp [Oscillospiraceae bacterium]